MEEVADPSNWGGGGEGVEGGGDFEMRWEGGLISLYRLCQMPLRNQGLL